MFLMQSARITRLLRMSGFFGHDRLDGLAWAADRSGRQERRTGSRPGTRAAAVRRLSRDGAQRWAGHQPRCAELCGDRQAAECDSRATSRPHHRASPGDAQHAADGGRDSRRHRLHPDLEARPLEVLQIEAKTLSPSSSKHGIAGSFTLCAGNPFTRSRASASRSRRAA